MDVKPGATSDVLTAHLEQMPSEKLDGNHVVDKETAGLMASAIKKSKLSHTSWASLRFYGFLFVAYCSKSSELYSS